MDIEIPRETLKTGHEMPKVGLGTWQLTGEDCLRAVPMALAMGYNHIDTADVYGNHREIAPALRDVDRDSLWITSKVNRGSLRYDDVLATCEKNLGELGVDYLDLYLIHWPDPEAPMAETFRALARLVDEGMTRTIGVSNFMVEHLTEALAVAEVPIVNNQIKFNPAHQPWEVVAVPRARHRGHRLLAADARGRGGARCPAGDRARGRAHTGAGGPALAPAAGHDRHPQGHQRAAPAREPAALRLPHLARAGRAHPGTGAGRIASRGEAVP